MKLIHCTVVPVYFIVRNILYLFYMPNTHVNIPYYMFQYNTSVNILPPAGVMLGAIRDIVSQENLTKVGIIYDDTFGKLYLWK